MSLPIKKLMPITFFFIILLRFSFVWASWSSSSVGLMFGGSIPNGRMDQYALVRTENAVNYYYDTSDKAKTGLILGLTSYRTFNNKTLPWLHVTAGLGFYSNANKFSGSGSAVLATAIEDSFQSDSKALFLESKLSYSNWDPWEPYLLFGVGWSLNTLSSFNYTKDEPTFNLVTFPENTEVSFAYETAIGMQYHLSNLVHNTFAKHLTISAELRYMSFGGAKSKKARLVTGSAPSSYKLSIDDLNYYVALITVAYKF